MRLPRRSSAPLTAALLTLPLSGCGSGRPRAAETPDAIATAATRAIGRVHTVRVVGTLAPAPGGSRAIHLDLALVNGRGAVGTISEPGMRLSLETVGGTIYVRANAAFWRGVGDTAAAARLAGRWGRAPAGAFPALATLTHADRLLSGLLSGHGALTRGPTMTLDGRRVVSVRDASRQGVLYVAATGPAVPVRLVAAAGQSGRLDFADYGARVALHAPAGALSVPAPPR